jgi:hypothetical protein
MHPHVIPWFTEDQWVKVKAISIAPDSMGSSYDFWLKGAEQQKVKDESPSVTVHKVFLTADQITTYAKKHGRDLSAGTRVSCAIDTFIGAA